jgi:hypothetical protein
MACLELVKQDGTRGTTFRPVDDIGGRSRRILPIISVERIYRSGDLGEIVFRLGFSCPFVDGIRRWKQSAGQNPDQRNDDEQLDERPAAKAAWPSSHWVTLPEPFEPLQAFSLPRRQALDDPKSYWPLWCSSRSCGRSRCGRLFMMGGRFELGAH